MALVMLPAVLKKTDPADPSKEITEHGIVAACDVCDNREWRVFQLQKHNHFHLQCSMCGQSYCPAGPNCT